MRLLLNKIRIDSECMNYMIQLSSKISPLSLEDKDSESGDRYNNRNSGNVVLFDAQVGIRKFLLQDHRKNSSITFCCINLTFESE